MDAVELMTPQRLLRGARVVVLVLVAVVLQEALMNDIVIHKAHPEILVLLPIMAGILVSPGSGAVTGFVVGLAADCFLPTPFGMSAIVFTLVGYASGALLGDLAQFRRWMVIAAGFLGSLVEVAGFALLAALFGQPSMLTGNLIVVMVVVAVCNGFLALPTWWAMRWAGFGTQGESRR